MELELECIQAIYVAVLTPISNAPEVVVLTTHVSNVPEKVAGTRWTSKVKKYGRFKIKLVALGWKQRCGVDCGIIFAFFCR